MCERERERECWFGGGATAELKGFRVLPDGEVEQTTATDRLRLRRFPLSLDPLHRPRRCPLCCLLVPSALAPP